MGSKTNNKLQVAIVYYSPIGLLLGIFTMRIIIAFCAFMGCYCSQYIQVGEKVQVGEDQRLGRLLKEKTDYKGLQLRPMKLPRQYYENKQLMEMSLAAYNKGSRRSAPLQDYDGYGDLSLKNRAVDLMRHAVYHTQYRMRDLQRIMDTHKDDNSFRIGYIFTRLDHIIRNMRIIFSKVNKTLATAELQKQMWFTTHLVYYSYFLKHNHDVTYIVENLMELHEKIQRKVREKAENEARIRKQEEEAEKQRKEQEEMRKKRQQDGQNHTGDLGSTDQLDVTGGGPPVPSN